jgi:hypothetical protein
MAKSIYLAGWWWDVHLNGDQQCEDFIATQITNKLTVKAISFGLELVFEDDILIKAYEYEDGKKKNHQLEADELGLTYTAFAENTILKLVKDANGIHQLGGEIPDDFQLPENKCVVPFQYLGYISNQEENFSWLPFKVHLTCPIYLNIDKVFLDYSNAQKPFIINRDEVEQADTEYDDDLNRNSEIVYNKMNFSFIGKRKFSGNGWSGIPNWIQRPEIPICPKSGKRMKFLCQLWGGVTTKRTNVEPKEEWYRKYYEELNFSDGALFVFFEPTSKVACYFTQNT